MKIELSQLGRRFNKEWIFKDLDYTFESGQKYAVLGPNGSGKSTLLSVLMGNLSPSAGQVRYFFEQEIELEGVFRYISFAGPYLDLVEEFTLKESIDFHFQFKKPLSGIQKADILAILGLEKAGDKELKFFSSGMKQRTKLALAFCANSPLLVLDEPTSNLDTQGISWFQDLMKQFGKNRTIIMGSNAAYEYDICEHRLNISDYK